MNKKESVFQYVGIDELDEQIKKLNDRVQHGDIESLAVRLYLKDGTYKDIVGGYETEEERLAMLADLQDKINTKSN